MVHKWVWSGCDIILIRHHNIRLLKKILAQQKVSEIGFSQAKNPLECSAIKFSALGIMGWMTQTTPYWDRSHSDGTFQWVEASSGWSIHHHIWNICVVIPGSLGAREVPGTCEEQNHQTEIKTLHHSLLHQFPCSGPPVRWCLPDLFCHQRNDRRKSFTRTNPGTNLLTMQTICFFAASRIFRLCHLQLLRTTPHWVHDIAHHHSPEQHPAHGIQEDCTIWRLLLILAAELDSHQVLHQSILSTFFPAQSHHIYLYLLPLQDCIPTPGLFSCAHLHSVLRDNLYSSRFLSRGRSSFLYSPPGISFYLTNPYACIELWTGDCNCKWSLIFSSAGRPMLDKNSTNSL